MHAALPGRALRIDHAAFPREIFRNYGTYEEKMNHYGLNAENIARRLDALLEDRPAAESSAHPAP